jgi:hypothetical protein
MSILTPV